MFKKKDINNWSFDGKVALSNKWQIKRAEPVVLSAEESLQRVSGLWSDSWRCGYKDGFMSGDKNGRLREWLRPEQVELREAVLIMANWIKLNQAAMNYTPFIELKKALENLKPPTE